MSTRGRIQLRLALRNLRRQKRRSVLSGSAMVLAMALLVFSRAIAEGGHEDWIDAGVRMGGGHVSVEDWAKFQTACESNVAIAYEVQIGLLAVPNGHRVTHRVLNQNKNLQPENVKARCGKSAHV